MSTIITYQVVEDEEAGDSPLRFHVTPVNPPNEEVAKAEAHGRTKEGAVLAFKDSVTAFLPNENAMIFITAEQSEAMEGYTEKEKHGGQS